MHIAYLTHEFPPDTGFGGIGTYTSQISRIMVKLGHKVEVFTASYERTVSYNYDGIMVHRIQIENLREFKELIFPVFKQEHHKNAFDLIECPEIGGEAEFIKQKFPELPLVVRLHTPGVLVTRLQNSYQPFLKKIRFVIGALIRGRFDLGYWSKHDKNQFKDPDFLITQKASIITAPSEAMKEWAVKFWNIKKERIEVIANPFVPDSNFLKVKNETENKTITFIGRLNVLKGLMGLTNAVPIVLKKHPDWNFIFIGRNEGSHRRGISMCDWMKAKLTSYEERVKFIDWVDYSKLAHYYNETDICIVPSLFESFSYVCAEAMSTGKAIVGSNKGAIKELLGNNEYGLLANPNQSKQIAKAIIKLIKNKELRKEFGAKAREKILKEYNQDKIGKTMEQLYFETIKNEK